MLLIFQFYGIITVLVGRNISKPTCTLANTKLGYLSPFSREVPFPCLCQNWLVLDWENLGVYVSWHRDTEQSIKHQYDFLTLVDESFEEIATVTSLK